MAGAGRRKEHSLVVLCRSFKRWFIRLSKSQNVSDFCAAAMKSYKLQDVPLRIRPAFIAATIVSLLLLSVLGFHPTLAGKISPPVPFWDKVLHLFGFFFATLFFYGIWDVEDDARKYSSVWRHWPDIMSVIVCIIFGSIGSEFVQSLLPYKTFQWGDIIANIIGAIAGIYAGNRWMRSIRINREMRNLYQSLALSEANVSRDSVIDIEEQPNRPGAGTDTWDAGDPVFSLGDDDD